MLANSYHIPSNLQQSYKNFAFSLYNSVLLPQTSDLPPPRSFPEKKLKTISKY